jgi:predicted XRE-type DNA-binding protein
MTSRSRGAKLDVEASSGNVFADLGLPNAEEHLIKAQLVHRIYEIIRTRRWTQAKAAALLGISQPDVSRLLRGHFRDYSLERLLRLLMALDRDIEIVIKRKPASSRRPGRLQIVAA